MLEVKDLVISYGKIKAVKGISFTVDEGEVVTLIGTVSGPQWFGEDDDLADHLWPHATECRLDSLPGQADRQRRGARHRESRHRPLAGGPPHLQPHDSHGESGAGRLRPWQA